MALGGNASEPCGKVPLYRDGAVHVSHHSGASDWERHLGGDELVMVIEGTTTIILLTDDGEVRHFLDEHGLVVVPAGTWHRFDDSDHFKVMAITPQPTEHSHERPPR